GLRGDVVHRPGRAGRDVRGGGRAAEPRGAARARVPRRRAEVRGVGRYAEREQSRGDAAPGVRGDRQMETGSRSEKARAAVALLLSALTGAAAAQYPSHPVRFIVPSAAGGGTDIIARAVSLKLSEALGQQFVVDNRPGAGQMIGIELAAKAPPDGHTILMAASTLAINPVMYKKVPYDPLRDFAPITQAASLANVLVVHPSLPVKSLAELIAYAKARPGELNFASAG